MTIFHATDLHFNKEWFEQILKVEEKYDIFCLSGDFLNSYSDVGLSTQIEWISSFFASFKKPLFACSGNHDIEEIGNEEWLNNIPNIYADGTIKTINGVKFGCVPFIAGDFLDFAECDVVLNHLPPAKTKTSIHKTSNQDWGDIELARMLKNGLLKPKIILSGHMHKPKSNIDKIANTTIYNSGSDKKSKTIGYSVIIIKESSNGRKK